MKRTREEVDIHYVQRYIEEYQKKGYGACHGEVKALLFSQAFKCKTEDQLWTLEHTCEEHLIDLVHLHPVPKLEECWVSQEGVIIYCKWAAHDRIAEHVYFQTVGDFEKSHARITKTTHNHEQAMWCIKRPSKMMKRVVGDVFAQMEKDRNFDQYDRLGKIMTTLKVQNGFLLRHPDGDPRIKSQIADFNQSLKILQETMDNTV